MSSHGVLLALFLLLTGLTGHSAAQITLPSAPPQAESAPAEAAPAPYVAPSTGLISLSASFGADTQRIMAGLSWRVFRPDSEGKHALVAQSADPTPVFSLPLGEYLVHVSYGLAGGVRKVTIGAGSQSERVALNAGGLRVVGLLGELRVPPERLSISIFVPEGQNRRASSSPATCDPTRSFACPKAPITSSRHTWTR